MAKHLFADFRGNTLNQICFARRRAVTALAAALLAVSSLAAGCGNNSKEAPPTPSPSTSSVPVSPTEKSLSPNGGNKFTPSVVAPPPPTQAPGNHNHRRY
jgi:hypothetical protein